MAQAFFDLELSQVTSLNLKGEVVEQVRETSQDTIELSELDDISLALEQAEEQMATNKNAAKDPVQFLLDAAQKDSADFKAFGRKDVLAEFEKDAQKANPEPENTDL